MLTTRRAVLAPSSLLALLAAALILVTCFPTRSAAQVGITVTTTQQGESFNQCSLQEAIYASELKSNKAIGATNPDFFYSTGCTPGEGNGDTIILAPGAVYSFDGPWTGDSHNYLGPTATPIIFSNITIEGNGATLWSLVCLGEVAIAFSASAISRWQFALKYASACMRRSRKLTSHNLMPCALS
jgi:hypothetical protein